ncbi:hypothetical protein [uncultured Aquimarina sp.]|uniref:hypothetical protein n=1 Tax=uncultured Aquimarina sp. TaxID=575652 RepID=UPI0026093CBF|nr:hypothetical protein [uncultured Aquimarina sp.]
MHKKENNDWVYRKLFLISIAFLLINDFYLKYHYPSLLTGKLSDFTGLFAFPYFFSHLFKKNYKPIYILTGILFIFWKSSFSQFFIDFSNEIGLGLSRVVDYSDLIALGILPISYAYLINDKISIKKIKLIPKPILIGITSFSFIATSLPRIQTSVNLKSQLELKTDIHKDTIIKKFNLQSYNRNNYSFKMEIPDKNAYALCKVKIDRDSITDSTVIKFDSIKNSIATGRLFFGHSENELDYIKKLTLKDYELMFIKKIETLYKK